MKTWKPVGTFGPTMRRRVWLGYVVETLCTDGAWRAYEFDLGARHE